MRLIDQISHPRLKISIFKNDERFIAKIEHGAVAQIFKFDERHQVTSPDDLKKLLNASFLEEVENGLLVMKKTLSTAVTNNAPTLKEDEFEEII